MSKILEYFPLERARRSQQDVLKAIEKAFAEGYKNVLLEAPVGSGKSAIAVTVAQYFKSAHVLTPRKSLQDQYRDDFEHRDVNLVLMKGRSSYPCTGLSSENLTEYFNVADAIVAGQAVTPQRGKTCNDGLCIKSSAYRDRCVDRERFPDGYEDKFPCPYHVAITTAQESSIIVHNLHSFIFQSYFAGRFVEREILIIDECHEVEGIIRGFSEKSFLIPKNIPDADIAEQKQAATSLAHWADWFEEYADQFSNRKGSDGISEQEAFLTSIENFKGLSDYIGEKFVVSIEKPILNGNIKTKLTFIPEQISALVDSFLLSYGRKRLLMSGTIYNKTLYCKNNGLKEDETCFIRIGSTFPKATRPIYFKDDYKVDTSHKFWDQNFNDMIAKIKSVMEVFDDVKGLIHTPSYQASLTIQQALRDTGRIVAHTKDDLQQTLAAFYETEEPKVLLSPVCQQGVDFKYDRARFQIVIRVPYLNTSDPFMDYKVKNDFPWYNYQALVIFGQQIGRVNRSEDDFGVTVLMDERFGKFISRNRNVLPKWLTEAIIYK